MRLITLLCAAFALVACGGRDPVADEAENAGALPTVNEADPSPTGGPPSENAVGANETAEDATLIPATLRGRWGLSQVLSEFVAEDFLTPTEAWQAAEAILGGNARGLYGLERERMNQE